MTVAVIYTFPKTMKIASFVLLASVVITASAADNSSVTGRWKVHNNIAGNESDMACSFIQKDKDLAGTCQSDNGTVKISGTVDSRKVSWTYKSEHDGSPITLTYGGNLDSPDKMSGTVKVEEYGVDGEFTAAAAK
jgi:hypothetical protein